MLKNKELDICKYLCLIQLLFFLFQWSDNAVPYAIYRTVIAAYFLLMVFYTAVMGNLKIYMFIMLTYWSYYILATAQVLRAINSWYYVSLQKQGKGKSKPIFNNIGRDEQNFDYKHLWIQKVCQGGGGVQL